MVQFLKLLNIIIVFEFISIFTFAQSDGKIYLSESNLSSSEEKLGLSISGFWKYKSGDNFEFASPDFDDSNWDSLKSFFILDSIPIWKWKGLGWFRLHIIVDSSLHNKTLGFFLSQQGASEIYFDGYLIQSYGKIGTNKNDEIRFNPQRTPVAIYFDDSKEHFLAIRYSNFKVVDNYSSIVRIGNIGGFSLTISDLNKGVEKTFNEIKIITSISLSLFGILISLALLHLFIFFYHKKEKANLYYSLLSLSLACIFLSNFINRTLTDPNYLSVITLLSIGSLFCIFIFLHSFLYSIYYKKLIKIIWITIAVSSIIFSFVIFYTFSPFIDLVLALYIALVTIEGFRIIFLLIRKKIEGAWIIGSGVLGFLLLITFFFVASLLPIYKILPSYIFNVILYAGFISIPISMSIYLAKKFAKTNNELEKKLFQIKNLSEKTILQERKEAELKIQNEKDKAKFIEAELRAQTAELQAKASEAQSKALHLENERKSKELEQARQLQLSMLPSKIPNHPNYEIAVYMKTASEVGGDYYDFHLSDENVLTLAIGDATGHGVKAGIMVSVIKSLFITRNNDDTILEGFSKITKVIKQMRLGSLYMCLAIAKFYERKMIISNAGMPFVLIHRINENKIEVINIKGMPLGAFNNFPYEQREIVLNAGDTILFYSDGFPELFNANKDMVEYEKVGGIFNKAASQSPNEIINYLSNFVVDWCGGNLPNDDVTFVVIKVK